jgi:large subunit ribosomal protein L32
MAQPKRRWSKARTGSRRSTWKLENQNLVECPRCHEMIQQHRACGNCGYYDGKKVLDVEETKTK